MPDTLDPLVTEALRSWRIQLESGIASDEALLLCSEITVGAARRCFQRASERTAQGEGIVEVLQALSPVLSSAERAILAAGWSAGRIEKVLSSLVEQRALWYNSRRTILSKLIMPAGTLFLASFIAPLPALVAGGSIAGYLASVAVPLVAAIGVVVGGFIFFKSRANSPVVGADGKPLPATNIDRIMLRLPLVSHIERQRSLSEFGDLLANLLNAGLPIVQALDQTACAMRNGLYRRELERLSLNARQGNPIGPALREETTGLWPREFSAAVSTGEVSGALDATLSRLAGYARERYIGAITLLAEWLPKIIYGCVALFVIWNIFKMMMMYFGAIDNALKEVGA